MRTALILFVICSLASLIVGYVLFTYSVPTTSMEPALTPGDRICIWPFGSIERYGIVAYREPGDIHFGSSRSLVAHRLCGMPGDSLELRDCYLFTNGVMSDRQGVVKIERNIQHREPHLNAYSQAVEPQILKREEPLTHDENDGVSILLKRLEKTSGFLEVLGATPANGWTPDNFGPIYIPARGDVLTITGDNIAIYADLLLYFEGLDSIDTGRLPFHHTIQQNYYVILGDNRQNSLDSRFSGFVPEADLVGTVHRLW